MKDNHRIIVAWIQFLISEVFGILALFYLNELGGHKHVIITGGTTIVLNGHAMVLFRLLPCVHTYIIKYTHALIHTGVIAGGIYGTLIIIDDKGSNLSLHPYIGFFNLGLCVLQWIAAMLVFLPLYGKQRRRKQFAAYHNFVGVVILQLAIIGACIQLQDSDDKNTNNEDFAVIFMVLYGILINSIVLSPYLEWRLVGPL